MKIWLDDSSPAPRGENFTCICRNVEDAKYIIQRFEYMINNSDLIGTSSEKTIELIDIDIDLGDAVTKGGSSYDFIKWLEKTNRKYPIRIHAKNIYDAIKMFKQYDWSNFIDSLFILEE